MIDTNDIQGELVVEITIKKGSVTATFKFTVTGFITIKDDVVKALAKIDDDTIKGNNVKFPSQMTPALIAILSGFPETNNGVKFSATSKTPSDENGTLTIILTGTKAGVTAKKTIIISGFQIATQNDNKDIIKAELAKINDDTISGDAIVLPSVVHEARNTPNLIVALTNFPSKASGVIFSAESTAADDDIGTLTIILTGTKAGVTDEKTIIISGFQTTTQKVNKDIIEEELTKINDDTISGDATKLASKMDLESIQKLGGFPKIISNGISFSTKITSNDNTKGQLVIILTVTKGDTSVDKKITISGFAIQTADQAIVAIELAKITTINGDNTTLASVMSNELIKRLSGFPKVTLSGVSFDVKRKSDDDREGTLMVILIATKNGVSKQKDIKISGFKTEAQWKQDKIREDLIMDKIKMELIKIDDETINGDNNELPSDMTLESIKTLDGFPTRTNGVSFSIISPWTVNNVGGTLIIKLKATKDGLHQISERITISGFKRSLK